MHVISKCEAFNAYDGTSQRPSDVVGVAVAAHGDVNLGCVFRGRI